MNVKRTGVNSLGLTSLPGAKSLWINSFFSFLECVVAEILIRFLSRLLIK